MAKSIARTPSGLILSEKMKNRSLEVTTISTLIINSVRLSDSGHWSCQVKCLNDFRTSKHIIDLKVTGLY